MAHSICIALESDSPTFITLFFIFPLATAQCQYFIGIHILPSSWIRFELGFKLFSANIKAMSNSASISNWKEKLHYFMSLLRWRYHENRLPHPLARHSLRRGVLYRTRTRKPARVNAKIPPRASRFRSIADCGSLLSGPSSSLTFWFVDENFTLWNFCQQTKT